METTSRSPIDQGNGDNESNYRVPRMDSPKFEGSYEKWPDFSDAFKSEVHNNRRFTDSEKLMYLRSCLLGKFCHLCKSSYFTQYCEKLVNAPVTEHINLIKRANLCFNCLKSNHAVEDCRSTRCKTCNKKHHSLLHIENEKIANPIHVNAI